MKPASIIEIVIIVVLAIALILYLMRRNIKDEEDIDPELTKAFKDVDKEQKDN
jgi:short subunit fatty acids transporter